MSRRALLLIILSLVIFGSLVQGVNWTYFGDYTDVEYNQTGATGVYFNPITSEFANSVCNRIGGASSYYAYPPPDGNLYIWQYDSDNSSYAHSTETSVDSSEILETTIDDHQHADIGVRCSGSGVQNQQQYVVFTAHRSDHPPETFNPVTADYTNFTCSNNCTIPATVHVDDNSLNATSWNWTFDWLSGSQLYSEYEDIEFTTNLTGTVYTRHCAANSNDNDCVLFSFYVQQSYTAPIVNISQNITAPNFTAVIPTIPRNLSDLPDSLNRTTIRDKINGTLLQNISQEYIQYWDDLHDGFYDMITNILDIILWPFVYLTTVLSYPALYLNQLSTQYAEKSTITQNVIYMTIYSFPPKLANLVTYILCLDFVLILMHEFGKKH